MNLTSLVILGIVVGSNNMAVSFALGTMGTERYHVRIILTFGFFEFFTPLIGITLGNFFAQYITEYAKLVSSSLLVILGLFTFVNAYFTDNRRQELASQITAWKGLIFLALALSLDNLIVGFSFGIIESVPLHIAGFISGFSMLFTWLGLKTGRFLSMKYRKKTEIVAGLLLVMLGIATYFNWI